MRSLIQKTLKVLLIEDSPDYAELVRAWLADEEETEYVLNWSDSLLEGMNTLALGGVDVVLLDLGLPDSSGPETFIHTRNSDKNVPVIILSAGDSEALALRMVQEGAQDYLVKSSCTSATLKKAIQLVRGCEATPSVERRRELRYRVGQPVQTVILCDPQICCEGRIRDISKHGLQLQLPVRPEIGAAIRLSLPAHDALVLGEVRYCVSHENEFLIGVQLDQMLTNLTELANLNQEFLGRTR